MKKKWKKVAGGVTAPKGFLASAAACGIKASGSADLALLFSETPGRFVVTVSPGAASAFEIVMGPMAKKIGHVIADQRLVITGLSGEVVIDADVETLKEAWRAPLLFEEVR